MSQSQDNPVNFNVITQKMMISVSMNFKLPFKKIFIIIVMIMLFYQGEADILQANPKNTLQTMNFTSEMNKLSNNVAELQGEKEKEETDQSKEEKEPLNIGFNYNYQSEKQESENSMELEISIEITESSMYLQYIKDIEEKVDDFQELIKDVYNDENIENYVYNQVKINEFFEVQKKLEIPVSPKMKKFFKDEFDKYRWNESKGKSSDILKLSGCEKVIKRVTFPENNPNISAAAVQRETMLAMISYLFYPNLFVETYGYFLSDDGKYGFIIMKESGETLTTFMEKISNEDVNIGNRLFEFFKNSEEALKTLRLVNHDIKSDNILVLGNSIEFTLKIADFGFASFEGFNRVGNLDNGTGFRGARTYCPPILFYIYYGPDVQIPKLLRRGILQSHIDYDKYAFGILILQYVQYRNIWILLSGKRDEFQKKVEQQTRKGTITTTVYETMLKELLEQEDVKKIMEKEDDDTKEIDVFLRKNVFNKWNTFPN